MRWPFTPWASEKLFIIGALALLGAILWFWR
jgi:hypothetical protein